jgi:hypothetical protein
MQTVPGAKFFRTRGSRPVRQSFLRRSRGRLFLCRESATEMPHFKKVTLGRRFPAGRQGPGGNGLPQREDGLVDMVL